MAHLSTLCSCGAHMRRPIAYANLKASALMSVQQRTKKSSAIRNYFCYHSERLFLNISIRNRDDEPCQTIKSSKLQVNCIRQAMSDLGSDGIARKLEKPKTFVVEETFLTFCLSTRRGRRLVSLKGILIITQLKSEFIREWDRLFKQCLWNNSKRYSNWIKINWI